MQLRGWGSAIAAGIAGIVGTFVFDLLGLMAMGMWWDVPEALAGALGVPLFAGVLQHYGNGVALAIIFAGILPLFVGPTWFRALQFITIQTVAGVWLFMLPLMGAGPLGLEMGIMMPIMSLVRHWAYALVVGLLYVPLAVRFESDPGFGASEARASAVRP